MLQMFSRHPDIAVPLPILNRVEEFPPLHEFFIASMDLTAMETDQYQIDFAQLSSILDRYMSQVDKTKKTFVLKMPYYPLNCLEFLTKYFHGQIVFLNIQRPLNKIIYSFVQKGEDQSIFLNNSKEFGRQIKKLDPKARQKHMHKKDFAMFVADLQTDIDHKIAQWNKAHPTQPFINVDIEQFATSAEYLRKILTFLDLSTQYQDEMMSMVNKSRLFLKFTGKLKRLIPGPVRSWAVKLLPKTQVRV